MSLSLLNHKMWVLKIVRYMYALILWRNPTTFTKLTLRIIVSALVLILPLPNIAML